MKALILAAGQGTRLRPLTDDRPKCLVEYERKPILEYTLASLKINNISQVGAVVGYRADKVNYPGVKTFLNPHYATTNMVESLFCAESFLDDDTIIIYGDILFRPEILTALIESKHNLPVVIDQNWRELWERRMENPLLDAETLKLNSRGEITELGKKPKGFEEIQGQYIGLFKLTRMAIAAICPFYHSLDRSKIYDGKEFSQMYMTSFLQLIADNVMPLNAVNINGGWLEIDSVDDLKVTGIL